MWVVQAERFQLGALHGEDFHIDESNVFGASHSALADGLLSTDFLSQFDIDLDLGNHQIGLYQYVGACSLPPVALAPPSYIVPLEHSDSDTQPEILVDVGGHTLKALIDTGAPDNYVFRRTAAAHGLVFPANSTDQHFSVMGIGPHKVDVLRHVLRSVSVGDLEIENMPVYIDNDDGDDSHPEDVSLILGLDFVARVHLWISNSSKIVVMQFPPRPTPAPSY